MGQLQVLLDVRALHALPDQEYAIILSVVLLPNNSIPLTLSNIIAFGSVLVPYTAALIVKHGIGVCANTFLKISLKKKISILTISLFFIFSIIDKNNKSKFSLKIYQKTLKI